MTASDSRLALWSLRSKPVPELLISASILSKYSLLNAQPFSSDRVRLKTLCASSTTNDPVQLAAFRLARKVAVEFVQQDIHDKRGRLWGEIGQFYDAGCRQDLCRLQPLGIAEQASHSTRVHGFGAER